jgi:hypothetical protein
MLMIYGLQSQEEVPGKGWKVRKGGVEGCESF